MKNLIGMNLNSYLGHREAVWDHLPRTPLRHIEPDASELADHDALKAKLDASGLKLSTAVVRLDLAEADVTAALKEQAPIAKQLGATKLFTSVKAGDMPKSEAYAKLKQLGDAARELGVTLCLETHPDLMTNGDVARETMQSVDHPNVRVNFDTANVYYYTEGINALDELRKVIDYVASVHLKDTDGGFKSWHFPALGDGVVDFPAIFELLAQHGFHGPFNLEIEGIQGEKIDAAGICARLDRSIAYLQKIGAS